MVDDQDEEVDLEEDQEAEVDFEVEIEDEIEIILLQIEKREYQDFLQKERLVVILDLLMLDQREHMMLIVCLTQEEKEVAHRVLEVLLQIELHVRVVQDLMVKEVVHLEVVLDQIEAQLQEEEREVVYPVIETLLLIEEKVISLEREDQRDLLLNHLCKILSLRQNQKEEVIEEESKIAYLVSNIKISITIDRDFYYLDLILGYIRSLTIKKFFDEN